MMANIVIKVTKNHDSMIKHGINHDMNALICLSICTRGSAHAHFIAFEKLILNIMGCILAVCHCHDLSVGENLESLSWAIQCYT
jgi:hypothetical protein